MIKFLLFVVCGVLLTLDDLPGVIAQYNGSPACYFNSTKKCYGCKAGYYGDYCNNTCPGCNLDYCSKNGECTYGCKLGFHGDHCNKTCPENCTSCYQNFDALQKCTSCTDGYHGDICDKPCPEGCYNCTISFDIGHYRRCFECKSGYKGYTCSLCEEGSEGTQCRSNQAVKHAGAASTRDVWAVAESEIDTADGLSNEKAGTVNITDGISNEKAGTVNTTDGISNEKSGTVNITDGTSNEKSGTFNITIDTANGKSGPVNIAIIAGASAGGVAFLVFVSAVVVVSICRRRKLRGKNNPPTKDDIRQAEARANYESIDTEEPRAHDSDVIEVEYRATDSDNPQAESQYHTYEEPGSNTYKGLQTERRDHTYGRINTEGTEVNTYEGLQMELRGNDDQYSELGEVKRDDETVYVNTNV